MQTVETVETAHEHTDQSPVDVGVGPSTVVRIQISGGGKSRMGALLTELLAKEFQHVEHHVHDGPHLRLVDKISNTPGPDAHPCYVGSRAEIVQAQGWSSDEDDDDEASEPTVQAVPPIADRPEDWNLPEIEDLASRFHHHPPVSDAQRRFYEGTRHNLLAAAVRLTVELPDCPERELAVTKLEEAMFWANAAAARNPTHFTG